MKIKKRNFYLGAFVIVVAIVASLFYFKTFKTEEEKIWEKAERAWAVDENGYLSYPLDRGQILFNRQDYGQEGNLTVHKIIFQSRNANIYGLLVLPTTAPELLPGIVLLPGAGVSKESKLELAKKIALLDAAVLVIDQRGTGETNGYFPTLDEDYESFLAGEEPYQHLMVYDALRAYDLMDGAPFTDSGRIAIVGESLGGRIAVIAAAIDRKIKGVLLISSAGLDFKDKGDKSKDTFIKSIDSDHYIEFVTPRKLVMMHNANDNIIPVSSAAISYSKAQEPKQFILINDTGCNHGYCDSMYDGLVDALDYLVDTKSKTLASVPLE